MRVPCVVALTALAAGVGCSTQPPRETTDELARAQALVGEAEQSGAQQYAAADLQEARDKLQQANQASAKNSVEARHLALMAELDAQLATARASDGKAQQAVRDVNGSLDTLRSETTRHLEQSPPPGGTPASTPPPNGTPLAPNSPPATESTLPPAGPGAATPQ